MQHFMIKKFISHLIGYFLNSILTGNVCSWNLIRFMILASSQNHFDQYMNSQDSKQSSRFLVSNSLERNKQRNLICSCKEKYIIFLQILKYLLIYNVYSKQVLIFFPPLCVYCGEEEILFFCFYTCSEELGLMNVKHSITHQPPKA